jgi:pilus assembly protein Flp/PilA
MSQFQRFVKDESGATAIEYGLIAAGIAVVIITAVSNIGTNLKTVFNNVAANIK